MPQKIQYSNGNKAEYFYDASGVKYKAQWGYAVNTQNIPLGATGTENNSLTGVTRTEYCGNYVYEQGILRRIITPEGFVSTSNDVSTTGIKYTWRYNYFLKDHLGNTRRTLRSNTLSSISTALSAFSEIIDYYPFGMEVTEVYNPNGEDYSMSYLAGSSTPNLYNGKEIDRMHGLNMYDYGARWKDLNWLTVDPLAEIYYNVSPYSYCGGNPVNLIDPDGKGWKDVKNLVLGSVKANFSVGAQGGVSVNNFGAKINIMSYNFGSNGNGETHSYVSSGFSLETPIIGISKEKTYKETSTSEIKTQTVEVGYSAVTITNFVETNIETTTTTSSLNIGSLVNLSTEDKNVKTSNNLGQKTNTTTTSNGGGLSKDVDPKIKVTPKPLEIKVSAIIGVNLSIDVVNIYKNTKKEWEK